MNPARDRFWILIGFFGVVSACSYTEGQCFPEGEGGNNAGVGGGTISPNGSGGFGNVPPKPQDASGPMPPDCMMVPNDPCHQKCLSDYEEQAVKCAQIHEESVRRLCQEAAYQTYKSCKDACQSAHNDCYDKCDAIAEKEREKCNKMSPGPGQAKCNQNVNEQWATCYEECRKKK